jgi:hypothetical protein
MGRLEPPHAHSASIKPVILIIPLLIGKFFVILGKQQFLGKFIVIFFRKPLFIRQLSFRQFIIECPGWRNHLSIRRPHPPHPQDQHGWKHRLLLR